MDGDLVKEYDNETHGGMTGFLGCTTASLAADGKTIVYSSETGHAADAVRHRGRRNSCPTCISLSPERRQMVLCRQAISPDGTLMMITAESAATEFILVQITAEGEELKRPTTLPGPGWAIMRKRAQSTTTPCCLGNFFARARWRKLQPGRAARSLAQVRRQA